MTIGDKVAYSRTFLNGCQAPVELYDLRGEILEVKGKPARAKVSWNDNSTSSTLLCNLSKIAGQDSIRFAGAILEQS